MAQVEPNYRTSQRAVNSASERIKRKIRYAYDDAMLGVNCDVN